MPSTTTYQEYIPEELDLFATRPYLFCVKENLIHEYSPLHTVEGATSIEFLSLPYNEKYKDLSWVFLKLRLQLLKKDATPYKSTDVNQPHLVTNALHSIFKSAYVSLNGNSIRSIEKYHYKEWLEVSETES